MLPNKVEAGQPFSYPAEFFNTQIDVAREFGKGPQTGGTLSRRLEPDIVKVKNMSGSDVSQFGVLQIDDVVFSPSDNLAEFKNNFALVGVEPDDDLGNFVITLEPIPDGKFGEAVISGITPVQIPFAVLPISSSTAKRKNRIPAKTSSTVAKAIYVKWSFATVVASQPMP